MQPTRARYGVVTLAIVLAVLSYVQRVAISQAAGPISHDLNLNKAQMGLVFGAFGLSYAIFELPMGLLGDKLGARRILLQIVMAWSVFTALTGVAWNVGSMWVIRFLFGAGEAGCFPNLTRMLSVWLPRKERITAQSLLWAFTRWGGAATPPLVLAGISLFGWRWAFVVFAALGVVWCVVFMVWFRDDPANHKSVNEAELKLIEENRVLTVHHEQGERTWWAILLTPQVAILTLQYFCFCFVWYFYVTWLPTYLREARHQSATRAAAFSVLPLLLGGFGSLLSGFLPIGWSRRIIALVGFAATCILLLAFTQIHEVVPAMICLAFASFFSDITMPISWNACVEIGGAYTATVAATMNMLGNLAGFIAPTVGGFILQKTGGDWNPLIYLMAGAAALSASCWIFLDPGRKEGAKPAASNTGLLDAEASAL
ncbi:MAG TPA: MFS transporter [Granulicella sp.]